MDEAELANVLGRAAMVLQVWEVREWVRRSTVYFAGYPEPILTTYDWIYGSWERTQILKQKEYRPGDSPWTTAVKIVLREDKRWLHYDR